MAIYQGLGYLDAISQKNLLALPILLPLQR